jgi:hypothetical protein
VPVAINGNGEYIADPLGVVAEAVSVFDPAVVPKVQLPIVATPSLPVVTATLVTGLPPLVIVPPPLVTVKVTVTPLNGLLFASFMITLGGADTAVPATADRTVAEFAEMLSAAATGATSTRARMSTPARKITLCFSM